MSERESEREIERKEERIREGKGERVYMCEWMSCVCMREWMLCVCVCVEEVSVK